ncbi:uncharacterized protein LOC124634265 [Helicoverpa zea]|uniref:uncharacterized protein LOC124634265 n=1 Tax=Helicoverpa zea TaxID=7113 RepID=UPI001F5A43E1|nr:uncharacterized protein LOC124634265 [Helicoverpa zea]
MLYLNNGYLNSSAIKIKMLLHRDINILARFYTVFVISLLLARYSNAKDTPTNSSIKSMIVQEIMKKVSNITLTALAKADPEKKETVLHQIEQKLRKSARNMGSDANKYVKFIMNEFESKASEAPKAPKRIPDVIRKSINVRMDEKPKASVVIDSSLKKEIIADIAKKIQTLAKMHMKDAKTVISKKKVIEKIKNRIMNAAQSKHAQLHQKHDELKAYSSLIAQGVELSMQKLLAQDSGRSGRRMDSQEDLKQPSEELGTEDSKQKNNTDLENEILKKTMVAINIEEINKFKNLISESFNETSIDPRCDEILEDTCLSIQAFHRIPCGQGKSIPIENLCNGVVDCMDNVDEVNCTRQAMEKVKKATTVMSEIASSPHRQCFPSTDGGLFAAQNQILRDVLQNQMEFLEKHLNVTLQETRKNPTDDIFIKKAVTDVGTILSTLSYALDGSICAHRVDPDNPNDTAARKYNVIELDELEEEPKAPNWSPKSCTCKGQFCKDPSCEDPCKRICWQRYSLNHWSCQATNSATSVSLDVICDGKLDCFDQSDESYCATDANGLKFEALKKYSTLLDLLTLKSKSYEFVKSRNKLVAMHALVRQLQKHTIKTNVNREVVKTLRDEAFTMLVSIYDDVLEAGNLGGLEDYYIILMSISELLVDALKRSNTGNEILIPADGCYCRDGLCALRRCSKNCVQACLAEPSLTQYPCGYKNISVPIDAICNGKENCPNGRDEKDCKKDVCRGHHLVVLRHNIQHVGVKHRSSVLGEVLDSWKEKVSAALFVAEATQRPNRTSMVEIMRRVLHDLVMAFASMEDSRKAHSEVALKEFIAIANIVMQTLKTCVY